MSYATFVGKVVLADGGHITCLLAEEPDRGPGEEPLFWVEPVRALADGEEVDHIVATITGAEGITLMFRWREEHGETRPRNVTVQNAVTGEVLQDYTVGGGEQGHTG